MRGEREKPPWSEYYRATAKWQAASTLTKALALKSKLTPGTRRTFAIDLGCGGGRDTLELLRRGWYVLAVDSEPAAISFLRAAVPPEQLRMLRTRVSSFERVRLPRCDLINGSYSLPFCDPKRFDAFWDKIVRALRRGGLLAGHLFGTNDEWVNSTDMTFHTTSQVKTLLNGLIVEFFEEKEWDGATASGKRKHWHVFSIVLRKPLG